MDPVHCRFCNKTKVFKNRKVYVAHQTQCQQLQIRLKRINNSIEETKKQKTCDDNTESTYESDDDFEISNDDDSENVDPEYDDQIVDDTLYERHKSHLAQEYDKIYGPDNVNYHSGVKLLDVLRRAKCPLKYYDEIIEWAKDSISMGVKFDHNFRSTRNKVLDDINNNFDLHGLQPIEKQYTMLSNSETVPVVHCDFKELLYSLLNDPNVMHPDNLIDEDEETTKSTVGKKTLTATRKGFQTPNVCKI